MTFPISKPAPRKKLPASAGIGTHHFRRAEVEASLQAERCIIAVTLKSRIAAKVEAGTMTAKTAARIMRRPY